MNTLTLAALENRLSEVLSSGQLGVDTRGSGQEVVLYVTAGNKDSGRPDELVAVKVGDDDENFYNIDVNEMKFIKISQ